MMMTTKTGTVKIVAKTGGLIFEGEDKVWYNPVGGAVTQVNPSMRGSTVEITFSNEEKRQFSDIKVTGKSPGITIKEYERVEFPRSNNDKIIRQTCLKATASLLQGTDKIGSWKEVATEMELWVNRE